MNCHDKHAFKGTVLMFLHISGLDSPNFEGMVHPKMNILSYTHIQVVANVYEFLCSVEPKRIYFEECW